jgi:hypothetical protein
VFRPRAPVRALLAVACKIGGLRAESQGSFMRQNSRSCLPPAQLLALPWAAWPAWTDGSDDWKRGGCGGYLSPGCKPLDAASAGTNVANVGGMKNSCRNSPDAPALPTDAVCNDVRAPLGQRSPHTRGPRDEARRHCMTAVEVEHTLEALASDLPADDAGIRRLFDRLAAHSDAEALRDALADVGARTLLDSSEAYLAEAIDGWHRDRRGRAC